VLTANAATGIDLDTTIASLVAATTGTGSIDINETNALTVTTAMTANGAITISAGGELTATSVASLTDSGANDISLTATTGNLGVGSINAGTTGDVVLVAVGGSITDANAGVTNVTADGLTATAATGIDLDTAIASLDASVTGAGSLTIDEADAITLTDVDTANGSIAITAAGALAAVDVAATGGSVSLTSTGATGSIATTVVSGTGVTLVADAIDIGAGSVNAGAGTAMIRQSTNGTAISLGAETVGELSLTDAELDRITAGTLAIGNAGSGTITVRGAVSPANSANLSLTTGGAIANTVAGTDITVANLNATAASGITLDTAIATLTASVTGT